ncbi:hypothetical protein GALMADRAFT_252299 [Galerina marginata CBS 339.88]|uniref:Uncharacterized protein n=1 Tax=Galerina marginata (strain CBS 339.88) TaxID=685588 RepID=A0A067T1T7_GALM3|nr:hypothetical protein GALMADRAFT_252299 [Galerina marginata CBS 339.88]
MDVDHASSSSKRLTPCSTSSPSKHIKIIKMALPEDEMAILNDHMNAETDWPALHQSGMNGLMFKNILQHLTFELESTSLRYKVLPSLNAVEAKKTLASFSEAELEQWKAGVRRGIEEKNWASLVEHPKLQMTLPPEQEKATEISWDRMYSGEAADALLTHIQNHHNSVNGGIYTRYCSIIQSSGMGKSRTADELGKSHLSIPINLRDATSTGYPAADHEVRKFLTRKGTKEETRQRASCFTEALFLHANEVLTHFDPELSIDNLASQFRSSMTAGQTMQEHNYFRTTFYLSVVTIADDLMNGGSLKMRVSHQYDQEYGSPTVGACSSLIQSLKSRVKEPTSESKTSDNFPLLILVFDEAHTLMTRNEIGEPTWSNLSVIQDVLRTLDHFPVFSLFLSTTCKGEICQFTAPWHNAIHRKVFKSIEPYTNLSFDTLASTKRVSPEGSWNLENVTQDRHISCLGRPLFGSLYDAGDASVKDGIVDFAIQKLLKNSENKSLDLDQSFACLSHRFPIKFSSADHISRAEKKQVEGHLRVCLDIEANFQSMTSLAPSEPLLSEAAYAVMARGRFDSLSTFKSILEDFPVHKGDRGEFLVLLLLTLARDLAVGPPNDLGHPQSGRRFFDFASFMSGHLFKNCTHIATSSALESLRQDFPDAYIHFNHFVKLQSFDSIDKQFILLLVTRGAAVLCADNQPFIDGVNVFLKAGTNISVDNLGLLLWQVKNDASFTDIPEPDKFESMDPYNLNILKTGDAPVPVIRMFFALAAERPSLHVTRHEPSKGYGAVKYDIWIGGLSSDYLNPVEVGKAGIWEAILQASYGCDIYKAETLEQENLRRATKPGTTDDSNHWCRWADLDPEL